MGIDDSFRRTAKQTMPVASSQVLVDGDRHSG